MQRSPVERDAVKSHENGFHGGLDVEGTKEEAGTYARAYGDGYRVGQVSKVPFGGESSVYKIGLCAGTCVQLSKKQWLRTSASKLEVNEDGNPTLAKQNEWLLHCLEKANEKGWRQFEKNRANAERKRNRQNREQNNQMQTSGLWAPLKSVGRKVVNTVEEKAMNSLTKITHVLNSVHGGVSPGLSPGPQPAMNLGTVAP
ncbi:MAG: hypothetical protein M1816_007159 [Peltula sp. TS41687]|nr:MAG: hypothetical protein M1816_007159 [Peltula sp. TS41687]